MTGTCNRHCHIVQPATANKGEQPLLAGKPLTAVEHTSQTELHVHASKHVLAITDATTSGVPPHMARAWLQKIS